MGALEGVSADDRQDRGVFVRSEDVLTEQVRLVEIEAGGGATIDASEGGVEICALLQRELLVGDDVIIYEMRRPRGLVDPPHFHDHETVGYLISGRMKWTIEGVDYIAEPGCAWRHPAGIVHSNEALEDVVHITVKAISHKKTQGGN